MTSGATTAMEEVKQPGPLGPTGPLFRIIIGYLLSPYEAFVAALALPTNEYLKHLSAGKSASAAVEDAAANGWTEGLRILLEMPTSICWQMPTTDFGLLAENAAEGGHVETLRELIRIGMNNVRKNPHMIRTWRHMKTPPWSHCLYVANFDAVLGMAASGGHVDVMRVCIAHGATDFDGALSWAAEMGYIDAMREAVAQGAIDFNSALEDASGKNQVGTALEAISMGATNLNSALVVAAENGSIDIVRMLISKGATDFERALGSAMFAAAADDGIIFLDDVERKKAERKKKEIMDTARELLFWVRGTRNGQP